MREKIVRALKICLIVFSVSALVGIYWRLNWASETPRRPTWLPDSAAWISGPHTPLEFTRLGEWVGCRATSEDTARCWFTDYKGAVLFDTQFASVVGGRIEGLQIAAGELPDFNFYSEKRDVFIRVVRLKNGSVLAPMEDRADFESIQAHFTRPENVIRAPKT